MTLNNPKQILSKKLNQLTLVFIFSLIIFTSCKRDIESNQSQNETLGNRSVTAQQRLSSNYEEGDLILGDQLKNPYTIENMTKAYDSLSKKGIFSIYPVNIRETHYYVKFKPRDWDEYEDLK